MKKTIKTLLSAIAIVATASCAKENAQTNPLNSEQECDLVPVTLSADILDSKANLDGLKVVWDLEDEIAVYDGTEIHKFTALSVDGNKATFVGTVAAGASPISALYPYSSDMTFESGAFKVTLPSTQNVSEGKADPSAMIMAGAVSDGTISFKNATSLVKFTINQDGVERISLTGNNGEKFDGAMAVTVGESQVTPSAASSSTLTIIPAEGDTFAKGDYFAAIAPVTFEGGFILSYIDATLPYLRTTDKKAEFVQNGGLSLGVLDGVALPMVITTKDEFLTWAAFANLYPIGSDVKLAADMDMDGAEWIPAKTFYGNFDGQNHKVYNFKVTSAKNSRAGIFSVLGNGTDAASVKNLIVGSADGTTKDRVSRFVLCIDDNSQYQYAAVIPYAHNNTVIENVVNFADVELAEECTARFRLGGVAGTCKTGALLKNCINYGDITDNQLAMVGTYSNNTTVGGIIGALDGTDSSIDGCVNFGNILNNSPYCLQCGGIVGGVMYAGTVSNCTNNGEIVHNATPYVNGSDSGFRIRVGGITALINGAGVKIVKCVNNAAITVTAPGLTFGNALGGIVGVIAADSEIQGCTNTATGIFGPTVVTTKTNTIMGGIVGYTTGSKTNVVITKADDGTVCKNEADFTLKVDLGGYLYVGGIIGMPNGNSAKVEYAENKGKIKSASVLTSNKTLCMGGIAGTAVKSEFRYCKNSGQVLVTASNNSATFSAGGIIGGTKTGNKYIACVNEGLMQGGKGTASTRIGGICASFDPAADVMTDCVNIGKIYVTRGAAFRCGGLIGLSNKNIGTTELTICEGCVCNQEMQITNESCWNYYAGEVIGVFDTGKTETAKLNIGSDAKPVSIGLGQKTGLSQAVTLTEENYKEYILGQSQNADFMASEMYGFHLTTLK